MMALQSLNSWFFKALLIFVASFESSNGLIIGVKTSTGKHRHLSRVDPLVDIGWAVATCLYIHQYVTYPLETRYQRRCDLKPYHFGAKKTSRYWMILGTFRCHWYPKDTVPSWALKGCHR
jgi:hypothetical protein